MIIVHHTMVRARTHLTSCNLPYFALSILHDAGNDGGAGIIAWCHRTQPRTKFKAVRTQRLVIANAYEWAGKG